MAGDTDAEREAAWKEYYGEDGPPADGEQTGEPAEAGANAATGETASAEAAETASAEAVETAEDAPAADDVGEAGEVSAPGGVLAETDGTPAGDDSPE
ncbi:MAG: hypothetical protein ACR2HQ_14270, partial [Ilumatobacteraceae bacterium]